MQKLIERLRSINSFDVDYGLLYEAADTIQALQNKIDELQKFEEKIDVLIKSANLAAHALNVSRPIDSSSIIPHNTHIEALSAIKAAIDAANKG